MLINNAGIMPCKPLLQTSEKEIRSLFEVNVIAHLWVSLYIQHQFTYEITQKTSITVPCEGYRRQSNSKSSIQKACILLLLWAGHIVRRRKNPWGRPRTRWFKDLVSVRRGQHKNGCCGEPWRAICFSVSGTSRLLCHGCKVLRSILIY